MRVDIIGKRKNIFGVAVIILQRDFDDDIIFLAFKINRRGVQAGFIFIQMLDK